MKKLLLSVALFVAFIATSNAQTTVKKDSAGNYVAVKNAIEELKSIETGQTFTDTKGNVYRVLKSVNGKLYYNKTSLKTGNVYRVYIKEG